jgi:hypothetical protein
MSETLSAQELRLLIQRVFQPTARDEGLAIIVDLPDARCPDNPDWAERRSMAAAWCRALLGEKAALGLKRITLAWYRNAGSNNADLPAHCVTGDGLTVFAHADDMTGPGMCFAELFGTHSMVLAPTELSATAPLKVATRPGGFRAATMPGFLPTMIPALRLDYGEINRRVNRLKEWLDPATAAHFEFVVGEQTHRLVLDLRHRTGHASGGLFPQNGVAGNLPSGEAYIVPYEGEIVGDPSGSRGTLPVQIGQEVVVYAIEANKAVRVLTTGPESAREAAHLAAEPAYANLAELGLGVLGDFGLAPTGSILLDEKLGLHIAFGRSDHFGGTVGPADFSGPDAVIHLDRVYIAETQPLVAVREVRLTTPGRPDRTIIIDGVFQGLWSGQKKGGRDLSVDGSRPKSS